MDITEQQANNTQENKKTDMEVIASNSRSLYEISKTIEDLRHKVGSDILLDAARIYKPCNADGVAYPINPSELESLVSDANLTIDSVKGNLSGLAKATLKTSKDRRPKGGLAQENHMLENGVHTLEYANYILKIFSQSENLEAEDTITAKRALTTLNKIQTEIQEAEPVLINHSREYTDRMASLVPIRDLSPDELDTKHRTERYNVTKSWREASTQNAIRDIPGYKSKETERNEARAKNHAEKIQLQKQSSEEIAR